MILAPQRKPHSSHSRTSHYICKSWAKVQTDLGERRGNLLCVDRLNGHRVIRAYMSRDIWRFDCVVLPGMDRPHLTEIYILDLISAWLLENLVYFIYWCKIMTFHMSHLKESNPFRLVQWRPLIQLWIFISLWKLRKFHPSQNIVQIIFIKWV